MDLRIDLRHTTKCVSRTFSTNVAQHIANGEEIGRCFSLVINSLSQSAFAETLPKHDCDYYGTATDLEKQPTYGRFNRRS